VLKSPQHVLLVLSRPDCDVCERLDPVLDVLSFALRDVPDVVVIRMDRKANYRKGLLPDKYWLQSPSILFFPKGKKSRDRFLDREEPSYAPQSLLAYLHKHTTGAFDLAAVTTDLKHIEDNLLSVEREIAVKQVKKQFVALLKAPCSQQATDYLALSVLRDFFDDESSVYRSALAQSFNEFRQCRNDKAEDYSWFWLENSQLSRVMLSFLDKDAEIAERNKNQSSEASSTPPNAQLEKTAAKLP